MMMGKMQLTLQKLDWGERKKRRNLLLIENLHLQEELRMANLQIELLKRKVAFQKLAHHMKTIREKYRCFVLKKKNIKKMYINFKMFFKHRQAKLEKSAQFFKINVCERKFLASALHLSLNDMTTNRLEENLLPVYSLDQIPLEKYLRHFDRTTLQLQQMD